MYLEIIFLPLLGFLQAIFLGRYLGHKGVALLSCFFMILGSILSVFVFYEVVLLNNNCYLKLFSWIDLIKIDVKWSFYFDFLTCSILVVVYFVSTLVHVYSVEYMQGDPHFPRFMAYLSFFTFFMVLLITSGNLLQLFVGWEGVGLCSFLLVSFWYTRTQAVLCALKAFIVNRVGDIFFLLGLGFMFVMTNSLEYFSIFLTLNNQNSSIVLLLTLFKITPATHSNICFGFLGSLTYLEVTTLFLFIGAMSKSAQIFLHTWLPDAMEGPTPVSALIHAATMVAAGVFLILKMSVIFNMVPTVLCTISFIGALTAFISASIGLFQNDLKKVIAYSTCSQLGYMFFIAGLSFYNVAFFHLCSHAFFKALLFLCAGSIIHALHDSQDSRKMGGLLVKTPYTYISFVIGSISLSGLPFLSGYYSKEAIVELSAESYYDWAFSCKTLALFSALLTSFYTFKLIYLTFYSPPKMSFVSYEKTHEPGKLILIVLGILSVFSIFFGFFFKDMFLGYGNVPWISVFPCNRIANSYFDAEFSNIFLKSLPILLTLFGIYGVFLIFFFNSQTFTQLSFFLSLSIFFYRKWHFDLVYNSFFGKFFLNYGYSFLYKIVDKGFLEYFGPLGLEKLVIFFSKFFLSLQTGYLYHYVLYTVSIVFVMPLLIYITSFVFSITYQTLIYIFLGIIIYYVSKKK